MRFEIGEEALKLYRLRQIIHAEGHRFDGAFVVIEGTKTRFRPLEM